MNTSFLSPINLINCIFKCSPELITFRRTGHTWLRLFLHFRFCLSGQFLCVNHNKSIDQVYAPLAGSGWQVSTASLVHDGSYGFTKTVSICTVLKFKKSLWKKCKFHGSYLILCNLLHDVIYNYFKWMTLITCLNIQNIVSYKLSTETKKRKKYPSKFLLTCLPTHWFRM